MSSAVAVKTAANEIEQFVALIKEHDRFLVVSHESPDGDAIGATLSMGLVLEAVGKEVVFFNVDEVPYNFRFLPGASRFVTEVPEGFTPEVTVLLDCAEPQRAGGSCPKNAWGSKIAVVDHHKTWDPDFADLYVRDVAAAATGELVYRIAGELGVMTSGIAHSIYCCLLTDTGSFRYSNTSRETFTIAGELIEAGVDAWHMTSHIYESQPLRRLELLGAVLQTLSLTDDGRLATLRLEASAFDQPGDIELTDGFINFARSIRGVEVATQMTESAPGSWKISFRSRGNVDVSELAARFGGGGHHNAAGCRIDGSVAEVEAKLGSALSELLKA